MGVRRRKEEKKVEDESEDTEFTVRKSQSAVSIDLLLLCTCFLSCCVIMFGSCVLVIIAGIVVMVTSLFPRRGGKKSKQTKRED